jgi:hypothetical protein
MKVVRGMVRVQVFEFGVQEKEKSISLKREIKRV